MLMRRDGDVFWPAKGGARALSVRGEEETVGGETSRVIIHIIYLCARVSVLLLLYIILLYYIVMRRVRYPTPTAVVVHIPPLHGGRGPLSSVGRLCTSSSFVCECVCMCVCRGGVSVLQARRREIKRTRRRLVSGAHTHTYTRARAQAHHLSVYNARVCVYGHR